MYSGCIRCRKSLGRNSEIIHLRVGRRIAFDGSRGRLWVVCPSCGQWNLVPIEERWEAVAECEAIAARAESRGGTTDVGFARTESGLELLRVGGLADADIANWRYGRGLARRQSVLRLLALALGGLALAIGVRAGVEAHSPGIGVYTGIVAALWLAFVWREPPRILPASIRVAGRNFVLWPTQQNAIQVRGIDGAQRPAVIVPNGKKPVALTGPDAAQFLAKWLPRINGASCAEASIRKAVARVDGAERHIKRDQPKETPRHGRRSKVPGQRPPSDLAAWELVLGGSSSRFLVDVSPEDRLALEMAVTEYVEQAEITTEASTSRIELAEQEGIAAIADNLLTDPSLEERMQSLRAGVRPQTDAGDVPGQNEPSGISPKRSNER